MSPFTRREFLRTAAIGALAAGSGLALSGVSAASENDMVLVEGGKFEMGLDDARIDEVSRLCAFDRSWFENMRPRSVEVADFHIDRYPVTNKDYYAYVLATGAKWSYGEDTPLPAEIEALPVVGLAYLEADAYAKWAGKRMPTEAEWERAARGPDNMLFAWGDKWDQAKCNCGGRAERRRLRVAGLFAANVSPCGAVDMTGNVCEWTSTVYAQSSMAVKGGCFHQNNPYWFLSSCRRMSQLYENRQDYLGFRCAKDKES